MLTLPPLDKQVSPAPQATELAGRGILGPCVLAEWSQLLMAPEPLRLSEVPKAGGSWRGASGT